MKLSEKLIKLRKEKKLSQEEFGNEINVSRQAVSKWENEETKPDIDKIQEIVKKFNVSYEYLLNDEIESEEVSKKDKVCQKSKRKTILKIILIVLIIYLLISAYKFIAFTRFYLVANSFSEENYSISENSNVLNKFGEKHTINSDKIKFGNKLLERTFNFEDEYAIKSEDGAYMPYDLTYTDNDTRKCYNLNYDDETKMYYYSNREEDAISEEEKESLFNIVNINYIKENTLEQIPSGFKQILLASIDPRYYYVSIFNNEFRVTNFTDSKLKVVLNKDGLITEYTWVSDYYGNMTSNYSYDYVPDHQKEIVSPIESENYKDKIIFEE